MNKSADIHTPYTCSMQYMHTLVKTAVTTKKTCKKLSYYKVQASFNGLASQFAELLHIPMTLVLRS